MSKQIPDSAPPPQSPSQSRSSVFISQPNGASHLRLASSSTPGSSFPMTSQTAHAVAAAAAARVAAAAAAVAATAASSPSTFSLFSPTTIHCANPLVDQLVPRSRLHAIASLGPANNNTVQPTLTTSRLNSTQANLGTMPSEMAAAAAAAAVAAVAAAASQPTTLANAAALHVAAAASAAHQVMNMAQSLTATHASPITLLSPSLTTPEPVVSSIPWLPVPSATPGNDPSTTHDVQSVFRFLRLVNQRQVKIKCLTVFTMPFFNTEYHCMIAVK